MTVDGPVVGERPGFGTLLPVLVWNMLCLFSCAFESVVVLSLSVDSKRMTWFAAQAWWVLYCSSMGNTVLGSQRTCALPYIKAVALQRYTAIFWFVCPRPSEFATPAWGSE